MGSMLLDKKVYSSNAILQHYHKIFRCFEFLDIIPRLAWQHTTHGLCLARYRCVNTFPCGHRYTFRVSCVDYLAIMLLKTCFYANIPCDSHPRKTDPVSIEKGLWKRFYQERKGLQDMQHQLKSNQEQDPVLLQDIFNKASQNVQLPIFQNVECTMHRPRT